MRRSTSKAALDEAAKRRQASTGSTVDVEKCQRIASAIEVGEGAPKEGTVDSRSPQITLPRFKLDEISAGRVLQRGSFGTIREIRQANVDDEPDLRLAQDKKLLSDSLLLEGSKDVRYAMKVGAYFRFRSFHESYA